MFWHGLLHYCQTKAIKFQQDIKNKCVCQTKVLCTKTFTWSTMMVEDRALLDKHAPTQWLLLVLCMVPWCFPTNCTFLLAEKQLELVPLNTRTVFQVIMVAFSNFQTVKMLCSSWRRVFWIQMSKYKTMTSVLELVNLKYAGFLLGSLFQPGDGSSVFLWNFSDLSDNWCYTPADNTLYA
jgi:hypothetical protein